MKKILFVAAAAALLGACSTVDITTAHSSAWGIYAEGKPNGTAAGGIGAAIADYAAVPLAKSADGSHPITVPTSCGGQDAVSTLATINGTGTNSGPTGLKLQIGHSLSVGEPARLEALSDYQTAAGTSHDAMADWHNCSQTTPPAATALVTTNPAPVVPVAAPPQ